MSTDQSESSRAVVLSFIYFLFFFFSLTKTKPRITSNTQLWIFPTFFLSLCASCSILQYINQRLKHRERWVGALTSTLTPCEYVQKETSLRSHGAATHGTRHEMRSGFIGDIFDYLCPFPYL